MKALARTIYRWTGYVDVVAAKVSTFLIFVMACVVVLQVVCRYVLNNPPVWTEELSRYIMIWASFIAMGSMVRTWDCVKVDFVVERFGGRVGKAMRLGLRFLVFVLSLAMVILCLKVYPTVTRNQVTPALRISMLVPQSGIIVGMAILTLQSIAAICAEILDIGPGGGEGEQHV
jgi:TRAP-type C4-dicarboxylate transport system, small permease component